MSPPFPPTMSAIVQRRYGTPSCLSSAELHVPEPGPGDVLVRVRAAAIDQGTLHVLHGSPYIARPSFGLRRPKRVVPGLDVAGVVEAVGTHVTGFAAGDEVFGIAQGSLAEYAIARADKLADRANRHRCRTVRGAARVGPDRAAGGPQG